MEWLTDKEKRLLFAALTREKKVCAEVDKEGHREPYEESLVSVIESLERKFYYDRTIKKMSDQVANEAINKCVRIVKTYFGKMLEEHEDWGIEEIDQYALIPNKEICKEMKRLKETTNWYDEMERAEQEQEAEEYEQAMEEK